MYFSSWLSSIVNNQIRSGEEQNFILKLSMPLDFQSLVEGYLIVPNFLT